MAGRLPHRFEVEYMPAGEQARQLAGNYHQILFVGICWGSGTQKVMEGIVHATGVEGDVAALIPSRDGQVVAAPMENDRRGIPAVQPPDGIKDLRERRARNLHIFHLVSHSIFDVQVMQLRPLSLHDLLPCHLSLRLPSVQGAVYLRECLGVKQRRRDAHALLAGHEPQPPSSGGTVGFCTRPLPVR
jgi:hypothetical protein